VLLSPVTPPLELVGGDHVRQAGVDVQHLGAAQHGPEAVQDPPSSLKLCMVGGAVSKSSRSLKSQS
jgi:hypothetical protein